MTALNIPLQLDRALRRGFFDVVDPGDGKEIAPKTKGYAICPVTTAGAETRVLPTASKFGVGTRIRVLLYVDGGDLTITGAAANVVLDTAGDYADFDVVKSKSGSTVTYAWRLVSSTTLVEQAAALPADTSGFAKLELSKTETAAENAAALIYLTEQLQAAGVIDTVLTQATK